MCSDIAAGAATLLSLQPACARFHHDKPKSALHATPTTQTLQCEERADPRHCTRNDTSSADDGIGVCAHQEIRHRLSGQRPVGCGVLNCCLSSRHQRCRDDAR